MAKIPYVLNNKKYYEIYVQGKDLRGKRIQKKTKFDSNGNRIASSIVANRVEFELKKEVENITKGMCYWTWEAWHSECLKRMRLTLKASTLMGYDGDLKKWIPKDWLKRELTHFSKGDIHELIFESMTANASAHRRQSVLKKIRRLFELALEEGIISRNPATGLRVKIPAKAKKVLSASEANELLVRAKECDHRFYSIWAFALFTGMRNGEIYAIRHSDINMDAGLIHVTKQFTSKDGIHETKANKNRVVPISDELRPLLTELIGQSGFKETLWQWANDSKSQKDKVKYSDLLLPRIREWRSGEQAAVLRDFCKAAGISEVKFHDLRATFITNMLAQGVPLTVVMKIVGHSKMSTTDEYNRLAGVGVKGSTNKLGYALPSLSEGSGNVVNLFGGSK